MNELQLHDIKGLVEIPDYSLYVLLSLIILGVILVLCLCIYGYKYLKKNTHTQEKVSASILKEMDFTITKQAAYLITHHGRIVAKTPRDKKLLEELILDLTQYKYKKNTPTMQPKTTLLFEQFMESIDV